MSATIFFRQVKLETEKHLSCVASSHFLATMQEVFGDMPIQLSETSIDLLSGMAAMCRDGGGNPYRELIDAIRRYEVIEVWPEL